MSDVRILKFKNIGITTEKDSEIVFNPEFVQFAEATVTNRQGREVKKVVVSMKDTSVTVFISGYDFMLLAEAVGSYGLMD